MKKTILRQETGSITMIAIIVLFVLTIIGLLSMTNANTGLQIAGNDRRTKIAFFAAEAARGYVAGHSVLYGSDNEDKAAFPVAEEEGDDPPERFVMDAKQAFNGEVEYLPDRKSELPRGMGYSVGMFKAHVYQMTCNGFGPDNAQRAIEVGFFRIGM